MTSLLHIIISWNNGLILCMTSTIIPSNMMYPGCSSCGQSPYRNAPDISTVNTFLSSIVSIIRDPIRVYNDTVGELVSSYVMYSHYGHPSAHPIHLIFLDCFL